MHTHRERTLTHLGKSWKEAKVKLTTPLKVPLKESYCTNTIYGYHQHLKYGFWCGGHI